MPRRIGMSEVVTRRKRLPVPCHEGTFVGEYVPFYFCPRSVMLYVIGQSNHPSLTYRGGQTPIVHLEVDLHRLAEWAERHQHLWAFSLSNAAESYAQFRCRLGALSDVNWDAVKARQWSGKYKAAKQAEFLVYRQVPWSLIERIGVRCMRVAQRVMQIVSASGVGVEVRRDWYYWGTAA